MHKDQLLIAIVLSTALVFLILGFLLFVFFLQRARNNRFLLEKDLLETRFNEQLLQSQLEIQEQTFDAISMEIHDNVGQMLSVLRVQLNILEQKQVYDQTLVSEIKSNASNAMTDLRNIAKSLSSERIQLSVLSELVQHELLRLEQTGLITTELQLSGTEQSITSEKKLIIFRMIQESLQNIIKHARATKVDIAFTFAPEQLQIEITDNGKGFEENTVNSGEQGLGLKNIRQRAGAIGGEALIRSISGSGTTVILTIPL